ncbi:hypothetical protein AX16_003955 [Volvariella volvacea WC 439]|nr:hypothetical protein AX16_003955 [Volvariella volvacea WC 439]
MTSPPPNPHNSATAKEIEEIDTEITQLLERLHQLRVRRNELVRINQVPRELLEEVMHHVMQGATREEMNYDWAAVSQVCKHWRGVALKFSGLWTNIVVPPTNVKWIEEMCKRSGSRPLSIQISSHTYNKDTLQQVLRLTEPKCHDIACVVQQQSHRIQKLHLTLERLGDNGAILAKQLTSPAPILEHIYAHGWEINQTSSQNVLFSGYLPKLQSLNLTTCGFTWNTPLLARSLENLKIIHPGSTLPAKQLSSFFASLPRLQALELDFALQKTRNVKWDTIKYGQGPIQVPTLRTLHVKEFECSTIANLLSRICHHDFLSLRLHSAEYGLPQFLDKIVGPALRMKPAATYLESGFNLSLLAFRESKDLPAGSVVLTLSIPANNEIFFEMNAQAFSRASHTKVSKTLGTVLDKLPFMNVQELTLGGVATVRKSTFLCLSESPGLNSLVFQGTKREIIKFVARLVDAIPQCAHHKQQGRCIRSFRSDGNPEPEPVDTADPMWATLVQMMGPTGAPEGEDDDSDEEWSSDPSDGNIHRDEWSTDRNSPGDNYQKLCHDVAYCAACEGLGKLFFPSLRRLAFRDIDLDKVGWWVKNDDQGRLHPLAEFIVRRIRCSLPIEELRFEAISLGSDWPKTKAHLQKQYDHLCGIHGPSIAVYLLSLGAESGNIEHLYPGNNEL